MRIAMWSGPRNISTAMMRSFGARADTVVVDEPFYAYYLDQTGLDHPGRDQILASQPRRWQDVVAQLSAPLPDGITVQYQKQMTHHILPQLRPGIDGWFSSVRHAYLIRDPARVIASNAKVRDEPTLADLGFEQQARIFEDYGGPVVDADDLLADPPGMLARLCAELGIPSDRGMVSWPSGRRATDGVWAPHWYAAVEASTGFAPPQDGPRAPLVPPQDGPRAPLVPPRTPLVPPRLEPVLAAAQPYYDQLAACRLTATNP